MKFKLTSPYGELSEVRDHPHHGIDLAMPEGTELRSISDGVVERVVDFGGENLGKGVFIRHDDGTLGIYGHMNDISVKVGEHVNAGEYIGLSGNTGHSTGPHLHFGMKGEDGSWVDPTPIAKDLSNISGPNPVDDVTGLGFFGDLIVNHTTEGLRGKAADVTVEVILGILEAVKDLLLGATLIGSGVLILLHVGGWRDGGRWAGTLLVVNILIKFLFGVY